PTGSDLGDLATGVATADWDKTVTVEYGTAAQWLLVVENTGNTRLANVTLTREDLAAGGPDHGATTPSCAQGARIGSLEPGDVVTVTCETANIRSEGAFGLVGVTGPVINTAQVSGVPVNANNVRLADPDDPDKTIADVESDESSAEARTTKKDAAIDIEKFDTVDDPTGPWDLSDITDGDFDSSPGRILEADAPTPIRFRITNEGEQNLIGLSVKDSLLSGSGALTNLTCDFSALGGPPSGTSWSEPFEPGESFDCSGVLDGLAAGATHSDLASVTAVSANTLELVQDEDPWNAFVPDPGITLTKWACSTGTACGLPAAGGPVLADLAGGHAAGGWVKQATIPYAATAKWLLVVTNTGNMKLLDVELTQEDLVGAGASTLTGGCAVGAELGPLLVGESVTVVCETASITNTNPFGAGAVLNTAAAQGQPVGAGDTVFDEVGPIASQPDSAEVRTDLPATLIDIQKYDVLGSDDRYTGDRDTAPGQELQAKTTVPIRFLVTNTGDEALLDVAVTDRTTAGTGEVQGLTCDFDALGGPSSGTEWVGPFLPGASFECSGSLPALGYDASHTDVATTEGTGVLTGTTVTSSDPWNGHVPDVAPQPDLTLAKWVCDDHNECNVPGGDGLRSLASGVPADGWVKATTVPYDSPSQWLLVLANTGDTPLKDITLSQEDLLAGGGSHGVTTWECAEGQDLGSLQPGDYIAVTCQTPNIRNTAALDSTDPADLPVVNTADAEATPLDADGQPLTDENGVVQTVESGPDQAKVNAEVPVPALDLHKWVCEDPEGCDTPDDATLASLAAGTPAGDWVKRATLAYGADAPWLLVVKNVGNTRLGHVHVTREDLLAGGGDHGTTSHSCAVGTDLGSFDLGQIGWVECDTRNIRNTAQFDTGDEVINTAIVQGTPVTAENITMAYPDGTPLPDVESDPSEARVNTVKPSASVDIEKYDVVGQTGPAYDKVTGDFDAAPGRVLAAGDATPIRFTVVNTGDEKLVGVRVSDTLTAGVNKPAGLTCDFSALGGPSSGVTWEGPLLPGASFDCTATVAGLAAGLDHTDEATVTATAEVSGESVDDTDPWSGHVPNPGLTLTKWACSTGASCVEPVPGGDDLSQLAGGHAAGGWVKRATVPYGQPAAWLLVVTNTGNTHLADVTLTREDLTGDADGVTGGCAVGADLGSLAPGASTTIVCRTESITNTAAFGAGAVVNTAAADGTPVDPDGDELPVDLEPTEPDSAEVRTDEPETAIDIEKYDTLGTDDAVSGD
ncbi:MAG: hypothetical protein LBS56_02190, partial [Propionibacteriaceae bacterium]|nr:hypothetical protein [Propionibacteriaceae bacterium]